MKIISLWIKKNNFCPKCGSQGETYDKLEYVDNFDIYSFSEEHGLDPELFFQHNKIIMPNRDFGSCFNASIYEEESSQVIDNDMIESVKQKFKEAYGLELKVEFGAVSYFM